MIHTIDLKFQGQPKSIAAYLIETTSGPILFETGPYSCFRALKQGVEDLGFRFKDIKHVFVSHVHLDHAGAAWALAEHSAIIYVHPLGAPHLADPSRLMSSAKRIYQDQMDSLWGDMKPIPEVQLQIVEHGRRTRIGKTKIRAWHSPGHASHHVAWQIDNTELITGDVAGVKILGGSIVPPCPPPDINLEDWEKSILFLKSKRYANLYISHFGKIEGHREVKEHWVTLKGRLWNWANWIKPYYDQGMSLDELTPKFEQYVEKQLRAEGADDRLVALYNNANPIWMSVAGLVRYWKKKEAQ